MDGIDGGQALQAGISTPRRVPIGSAPNRPNHCSDLLVILAAIGYPFCESEEDHAMPRVECLELPGLDAWFNSSDHGPPHFHVREKGQWEIRVYFRSCVEGYLDFSEKFRLGKRGPSPKDRTIILKAVLSDRDRLYLEWQARVPHSGDSEP